MKEFINFKYMMIDGQGNASYGRGGPRTYKTLKAAYQVFNSLTYYTEHGYKIVKVYYEELKD